EGPSIEVVAQDVTEEAVSTDTVVANFSSSDPEGDVQTYQLLNNDDGYFVLDSQQVKLTAAGVAAVNDDSLNLSELNISVEVTANGKSASDSDVANILRVDEGPSIDVVAQDVTEEAVSTDTVVANFSSSDPEGDVQTYQLLNNDDGYFVLDGQQVKLTAAGVAAVNDDSLNLSELNISVEVTANGKSASDSDVANILRVDEGPSIEVVAQDVTEEAVSTDTVVANFSSSDPEGDVQTYQLLNNDDGYFVLDGQQVKLTAAGVAAVNDDSLNLSELNISVEVTANGKSASDSDIANVIRVNEAPDAQNDDFSHLEAGQTVDLDLLANDSDPEGDGLSIQSIDGHALRPGFAQDIVLAQGVVHVNEAGEFSFTANADASGGVAFSYVVQDSYGNQSSAQVTGNVINLSSDVAQVAESGLTNGSQPSEADTLAEGNLLSNDQGLQDGLVLTSVTYDGQPYTPDANGVINISSAYGELSVYTADYNGHSAGDYQYQLTQANLAGDDVSENFTYIVSQPSSGFVSESQLKVSILDDQPIGSDIVHSFTSSPEPATTNLVLVLDTSASMTNGEHGDGLNYLNIAVEALTALIEQADERGNVNIQIIGFSDNVKSSGWISDNVAEAIEFLNDLSSGGGTHYDAALNEVIASSGTDQQPSADNTLLYFISDGEPNLGYGIDDTVQYQGESGLTAWDNFVRDHIDTSYGIGIGKADLEVLKDVASESASDEYAFIVDDPNDLAITILETYLDGQVEASLGLLRTASTDGFMVGADDGFVSEIVVDGVRYTYDPDADPEQAKTLNLTTALGGLLMLNFVTGAYSYELDLAADGWGQQESFTVTVTDFDGDANSIDLVINTQFEAVVDANRDVILTNQDGHSTITVPSLALLWNDTGHNISFDGVDNPVGGSVSGSDEIRFDSDDGVGLGIHDSNFETQQLSIIAGAEDVDWVDFLGHRTVDLSDRSLFSLNDGNIPQIIRDGYSFTYQSELENDSDDSNLADQDWIKVSLAEGETLWVNMAFVSGAERVKVDAFIFDADGNQLLTDNGTNKFTEDWQGPRGSFTAPAEGEYYIQVQADNEHDSGWYQLHLTIDTSNAVYQKSFDTDVQEQFDYTIIGDGVMDSASAELVGVHGKSIDGGDGDEVLVGNQHNNTLSGGGGDDALVGYAGDDHLDGGEGADLLIGGQGNDILTGGDDSDMFAWLAGDEQGSSNDTITDFTLKADGDADVLNLSDLLQGENESNLESYLSFETVDNGTSIDTIISIDIDGVDNGASVHQTITLVDVDFSGMSDSEILSQLLDDQQLNIDK
uniref:type I secretion C-terminal target domain-containing protein n=1 Tax=Agarivorans sp. TaxID=1872412 RepID=UPI003CFE5BED